jgi:prephenate dehydrogenase
MKKIGIVGFGRFGELLAKLGAPSFDVHIIETDALRREAAMSKNYTLIPFESLPEMDFIFLAVPISSIKETIIKLAPLVNEKHVIIDLCSVKVYPATLMREYLQRSQVLATHPMFGPDSAKKGLEGQQIAFCPITIKPANLRILETFWESFGVVIVTTTPEAHDQDSVYSQAFTYSLARVVLGMEIPPITLKIQSFTAISEVARLSANDTEQLFHDVLFYNPYFAKMKQKLTASIARTRAVLDDIEAEQVKAELF